MQLHDSEKFLVGLLAILLVYLPWALGSTPFWTQVVACFLAATCLAASLLPRHGDSHSVTTAGQCKRLVRFPVFWFGCLFLILVGIQVFNTAWTLEGTEGFHWVEEDEHASWLPAGISTPWGMRGPLQGWLVFGTVFFTTWAAWIGITRRKSIIMLLGIVVCNAGVLALLGFAHIARSRPKILWFFEPPAEVYLAPFPHHWQGAAYFAILAAAAVGLAAHHLLHAQKVALRSSPSGLFAFVALLLLLLTLFSFSRAAAGLAGGLVVAFLCHVAYRHLAVNSPASRKALLVTVSLFLVIGGAAGFGHLAQNYLDRSGPGRNVDEVLSAPGTWGATSGAAREMFSQRPLFGWGSGSFGYLYQDAATEQQTERLPPSLQMEYAAGDGWRLLAEVGSVGLLLLLLSIAFLVKILISWRLLVNSLALFLAIGFLAGLGLVFASPLLDNPAFFTTWALLLTFAAILVKLESYRVRPTNGE